MSAEDTNALIEQRRAKLASLREHGIDPFANKFTPTEGCVPAKENVIGLGHFHFADGLECEDDELTHHRRIFHYQQAVLSHVTSLQTLAEAGEGSRSEWGRTVLHHALVGLLEVGLIGGAIFFLRSPEALPAAPALKDACNGDVSLCSRRLDEVVFPGAHNSMSSAELGWMFPNHEIASVSLLDRGIRALLFDVHYGAPLGDQVRTEIQDEAVSRAKFAKAIGDEAVDAAMRIRSRMQGEPTGPRAPYLCHGFCELGATPLVEKLEGVRQFLVSHPGEVLVFVIEDYVTPADIAAAFRDSGLERFVYRGAAKPPWPTLRELVDSDQRILVLGENDTSGVPWYHKVVEVAQETPYKFESPDRFSCAPNRGGTAGSLFQINHWIETLPAPKPSNAAIVNPTTSCCAEPDSARKSAASCRTSSPWTSP